MNRDNKPPVATLKAFKLPHGRALVAHCPMCGIEHFHTEGDDCFNGVYAPMCRSGAASPYAGYRLDVMVIPSLADAVDVHAIFARPRCRSLWQQFHDAAGRLRALVAALVLQRGRPVTVFERKLPGSAEPFELIGTRWAYGPYHGDDLATAAARLYATTPGIVAVRAAEAALGIHLDARGFLEAQAAFDGFYGRGAKRGEGRVA